MKKNESKNAFKILPGGKRRLNLTDSLKGELKQSFGCQYIEVYDAYVCDINVKPHVSKLLERNRIDAKLVEFTNPLPKKSNKMNGLENRLAILEKQCCNEDKKLIEDAHRLKNEDGTPKSLYEFENPPKEPDPSVKNDDIRFRFELDIHERLLLNKEKKAEANEIRDTINQYHEEDRKFDQIEERLWKNESGDAEVFVELFGDKYIFDRTESSKGSWYLWDGSGWSVDTHNEIWKDFERVADTYLIASRRVISSDSTKKELRKRSFQLRTARRRASVLETASALLSFKESWDFAPYKLPCVNGVVDLKTGVLIPPCQKQFIKRKCPTNYDPQAKCPKFEQFLVDITLGDKELERFIARLIGYMVLGVPKEEKVVYLYGKGRNGKGTLVQTIQTILGSLAQTFPSEMLLMQRNPPSSSTANPVKANLEGVRLAVFSEIDKRGKVNAAEIKNLSGRDPITCRRLYSNIDLQIKPTHTMVLQTNYKPKAPADDKALWQRNILVPLNACFSENPNKNLKEELLEESEGILNWIVRASAEYLAVGLQVPQSVIELTERYKIENDGIAQFLENACVLDSGFSTQKIIMQEAIKDYCKTNDLEVPNRNEISEYLEKRFQERKTNKCSYWIGVKIEGYID